MQIACSIMVPAGDEKHSEQKNLPETRVPGFEPGSLGTKIPCLTIWRYPKNMAHIPSIILRRSQSTHLHNIGCFVLFVCHEHIRNVYFRSFSSASISNSRNCFAFFKS